MKKELVEVVFDRRKNSEKRGYGFLEVQIYLGRATRKYIMIGKYSPDDWQTAAASPETQALVAKCKKIIAAMDVLDEERTYDNFMYHFNGEEKKPKVEVKEEQPKEPEKSGKSFLDFMEEALANEDLREATGQLDRSMETLCAFLNGEGGTILYGVKDDGKIIGQTVSDSTKRSIAEAVNRIEPFVDLEITYVAIPGTEKYVIVIFVEEQRFMRPFTYKGRAYQRIESTTTVMPQERYNHLLMERGGKYGWEAMINPDLKIADLDENAILGAVREGIRNGRLPETTIREEIPVILKKFRLLNDGKLNNAAAVLFGKELYDYPQCLLRMARFKGTTKEEFIDNQRAEGNIYELLDAAMAFFFKHLSLSGKINGLYREEELSIPYKALRESCINSFCHRSYHHPGSSVSIAIYDDRVEIRNTGTFPADLPIERLMEEHDSKPQNPIIANVLYKSKILESWGRGISTMVGECKRVGLPAPEINTDGNFVWVVFKYNRSSVVVTPQLPHSYPTATPQLKKVISVIGTATLSAKEIMEIMSLKDKTHFLDKYLYPAIEQGYVGQLHPENPKHPGQKYMLTSKGKALLNE